MKLDIETVKLVDAIRRQVNTADLDTIELYENGERVFLDPRDVDEFKFTGLSNWDMFSKELNITIIKLYKKE